MDGKKPLDRDLNRIRVPGLRMDSFYKAMKDSLNRPYIGVTQGGSSRKYAGARVAAVISEVKQPKGNLDG